MDPYRWKRVHHKETFDSANFSFIFISSQNVQYVLSLFNPVAIKAKDLTISLNSNSLKLFQISLQIYKKGKFDFSYSLENAVAQDDRIWVTVEHIFRENFDLNKHIFFYHPFTGDDKKTFTIQPSEVRRRLFKIKLQRLFLNNIEFIIQGSLISVVFNFHLNETDLIYIKNQIKP